MDPMPAPALAVIAPPHVLAMPGVAATNTFAGRFSVNESPLCAGLPAPLVIVNVICDVPPCPITVGLKVFVSVVPTAESVAFTPAAVRPPASAEMLAEPLVKLPTALAVTFTCTWHDATALLIEVFAAAIDPLPAAAVTVMPPEGAAKAPPAGQFVSTPGVAATTTFAGSVSVKASPLLAPLPAPFVIVNVSTEVVPGAIDAGLNAFVSVGAAVTVSVADNPAADMPVDELVMFAGRLLYVEGTMLFTFALTVHVVPPEAKLAPESAIELVPAVAVTVPPVHVVVAFGVADTNTLVGSVSVNARPLWAGLPAPLVIVNVICESTPATTVVGLKAFVSAVPATVRFTAPEFVPAVGVCVVVTPLAVLGRTPVVVGATMKVTVQLPFCGMLMPLNESAVAPLVSDDGVVPVHVPPTV